MATMTLNTTAGEDARIVAAIGDFIGKGSNANAAEVKQVLAAYLRAIVTAYETKIASIPAPIAPT